MLLLRGTAVALNHVLVLCCVSPPVVSLFRHFCHCLPISVNCRFFSASDTLTVFNVCLCGHGWRARHTPWTTWKWLHLLESAATPTTHTHLLEHAWATKSTPKSSSSEKVIVIHHAWKAKGIPPLLLSHLAPLSILLILATHHTWESHLMMIVEKVSEGVTPSEKFSENIIRLSEAKAWAATTLIKAAREEVRLTTKVTLTSLIAPFESFFTILIVDLAFLRIGYHWVSFSYSFENFACFLLVVGIFVLI